MSISRALWDMRWLPQQKFIFSQLWGNQKSEIQVLAGNNAMYSPESIIIQNICMGSLEGSAIQGRRPCDNIGRYWSDVTTNQGMPGATQSCKRQEKILPSSLGMEHRSADIFISDLWPSQL
ncbi:unnamed protein product [Nyctereutes procyonoides]|uniref:(raccoon dog) hypothetical protein n=1 Tax=Nyctereutes procyonoides TaxID=34880 RepID=A0A811Y0U4_NYCPR|nr:unnamed protein product [Nyctereutes procyonoides]